MPSNETTPIKLEWAMLTLRCRSAAHIQMISGLSPTEFATFMDMATELVPTDTISVSRNSKGERAALDTITSVFKAGGTIFYLPTYIFKNGGLALFDQRAKDKLNRWLFKLADARGHPMTQVACSDRNDPNRYIKTSVDLHAHA